MEYPSIRVEELPDYAKNATCNLLQTYIDAHIQRLIEKCPGYGVQAISRLKSMCKHELF